MSTPTTLQPTPDLEPLHKAVQEFRPNPQRVPFSNLKPFHVGYEVYRIKTQVTEQGGKVEKGFYVVKRNKLDRSKRWEQLDEGLTYSAPELDRSVVVPSQIRTVLQAFKDALFTERLNVFFFLRDVRSRVYFEQMKGRGTRVLTPTDLQADVRAKTHFVIVDAVGVCESDKTDSRPLEKQPTVKFDKLLLGVALGKRDEDTLTTLAGRLARLDRELDSAQRQQITEIAGGKTIAQMSDQFGRSKISSLCPLRRLQRKTFQYRANRDRRFPDTGG